MIEFVFPILFALAYFLIRGMLMLAVAKPAFCRGKLWLSLLHGTFRATLYSLPLAGVIYLAHLVQMRA